MYEYKLLKSFPKYIKPINEQGLINWDSSDSKIQGAYKGTFLK